MLLQHLSRFDGSLTEACLLQRYERPIGPSPTLPPLSFHTICRVTAPHAFLSLSNQHSAVWACPLKAHASILWLKTPHYRLHLPHTAPSPNWVKGKETWRPYSSSPGPSCVFICWANFQPCHWSSSNYTGQATSTCRMVVNEKQIALRTTSSVGARHIYCCYFVEDYICFYSLFFFLDRTALLDYYTKCL